MERAIEEINLIKEVPKEKSFEEQFEVKEAEKIEKRQVGTKELKQEPEKKLYSEVFEKSTPTKLYLLSELKNNLWWILLALFMGILIGAIPIIFYE